MSMPITVSYRNGNTLFYFEQVSSNTLLNSFSCSVIEHNGTVIEFYQKNGFVPNAEMNVKRNKTISMRKDIFA